MQNKGQSAIEYLLIVGAAILIVAIIVVTNTDVVNLSREQVYGAVTIVDGSVNGKITINEAIMDSSVNDAFLHLRNDSLGGLTISSITLALEDYNYDQPISGLSGLIFAARNVTDECKCLEGETTKQCSVRISYIQTNGVRKTITLPTQFNCSNTYVGGGGTIIEPSCYSYSYSAWSTCSSSQQTRTVLSATKTTCPGENEVLTQSCGPPIVTLTFPEDKGEFNHSSSGAYVYLQPPHWDFISNPPDFSVFTHMEDFIYTEYPFGQLTFNFSASTTGNITQCDLVYDGSIIATTTTPPFSTINIPHSQLMGATNSVHTWWIQCTDDSGQTNPAPAQQMRLNVGNFNCAGDGEAIWYWDWGNNKWADGGNHDNKRFCCNTSLNPFTPGSGCGVKFGCLILLAPWIECRTTLCGNGVCESAYYPPSLRSNGGENRCNCGADCTTC